MSVLYVATTDSIFSVGLPTAGQGRAVGSWRLDLLWHHCPLGRGEGLWAGNLKALSPTQTALTYDLLQGAQYPVVGSSLLGASLTNIFRERYHPFHFSAGNNSVPWPCLVYNCTSLPSQKTFFITSVLED